MIPKARSSFRLGFVQEFDPENADSTFDYGGFAFEEANKPASDRGGRGGRGGGFGGGRGGGGGAWGPAPTQDDFRWVK